MYRVKSKLTFIILTLYTISCTSDLNIAGNKLVSNESSNHCISLADLWTYIAPPEAYLFRYSECKENCNDNERIISKKYKSDSLILKIGAIMNCIEGFHLELKPMSDTLDIRIKLHEEIITLANGKIDTVVTATTDCDCFFFFDIGIKHVLKPFRVFLINGQSFGKKTNTLSYE